MCGVTTVAWVTIHWGREGRPSLVSCIFSLLIPSLSFLATDGAAGTYISPSSPPQNAAPGPRGKWWYADPTPSSLRPFRLTRGPDVVPRLPQGQESGRGHAPEVLQGELLFVMPLSCHWWSGVCLASSPPAVPPLSLSGWYLHRERQFQECWGVLSLPVLWRRSQASQVSHVTVILSISQIT